MTARDVDALASEVAASFVSEAVAQPVLDAAKVVCRWNYGSPLNDVPLYGRMVLVREEDWEALRRAVEIHSRGPK